jgi:hypothetical protein
MTASGVAKRPWRRRGCWIVVLLPVLVFAGAHVGFSPGRTLVVGGADETPVTDAWAAYHYRGYRFNFVHSVTYERQGGIRRSDERGRITIPSRLYRKGPFDSYGSVWIDLLYVPDFHLARAVPVGAVDIPGEITFRAGTGEIVLSDLSDDPEAWERTIEALFGFLAYELLPDLDGRRVAASPAQARELVRCLRAEYDALLSRHADTARQPPPRDYYFNSRPPAEQQEILERIREDLARDPLWGPWLARKWSRRLDDLERDLAPEASPQADARSKVRAVAVT